MAAAATCSLAPAGHSSAQHSLELHLPQSITLHCQTFGSMLLTPHCVVAGPLVSPGPPHTSLPEVVSQQLSAIDNGVSLHRSCVPRSRRKRHSGSRQSWPRRPSKTVPSHSGSALGPTTRSGPPPPLPTFTHTHTHTIPTHPVVRRKSRCASAALVRRTAAATARIESLLFMQQAWLKVRRDSVLGIRIAQSRTAGSVQVPPEALSCSSVRRC